MQSKFLFMVFISSLAVNAMPVPASPKWVRRVASPRFDPFCYLKSSRTDSVYSLPPNGALLIICRRQPGADSKGSPEGRPSTVRSISTEFNSDTEPEQPSPPPPRYSFDNSGNQYADFLHLQWLSSFAVLKVCLIFLFLGHGLNFLSRQERRSHTFVPWARFEVYPRCFRYFAVLLLWSWLTEPLGSRPPPPNRNTRRNLIFLCLVGILTLSNSGR